MGRDIVKKSGVARYKVISGDQGKKYTFYCECSGALVHTTDWIQADTSEKALEIAWQDTVEKYFNRCSKCGRWVMDAMYNVDELQCVECAPYKDDLEDVRYNLLERYGFGPNIMKKKKICTKCGKLSNANEKKCTVCDDDLPVETLFDQCHKRIN